jgi:hypothetical protein
MFKHTFTALALSACLLGISCDKNPVASNPPSIPTTITVTAGDSKITVTWSTSTNANYYYIYYTAGSSVSKTSGTRISATSSPYTITSLSNGTQYAVAVTAVNADGESNLSSIRTATPISEYAAFWGIWKAVLLSGGKPAKFNLLLNNDFSFSFSMIMDTTGVVSLQSSGTYFKSSANIIRLSSSTAGDGYYQYSLVSKTQLTLLWVSGYDFMNASTPSTTTWYFFKP